MKKKKLAIESKKSQKIKTFRSRKHRDDLDLEDDILIDEEPIDQVDDNLDEFEQFQDLAHKPATLHEHEQEEEVEEEEEAEEKEKEINHKQVKANNEVELTARGNKNKHYVKPDEFEGLIKDYYKKGELTNELCDCVYKIANRLSYRPNFVNYSFREEMVGDAIERMVFALSNRIYKYNPKKIGKNGKKGNAFLYFTKIAENAFINRIKIESRNREAITNYQEDVYRNLLQKGIDIGGNSDIIDI